MDAPPRIEDYPHSLQADVLAGEERRVTTSGTPVVAACKVENPLVSIITIVFNNERHLERAMQSVFAQTYPDIEYIVIDGGSTDGTVEIIKRHADRLSYWHSRQDHGISDAFNMGVALSRGTYVGLVNSDDWMEPDQVDTAVRALEKTGAPFVFGDLIYHDAAELPAYRISGDPNYAYKLWHRMPQLTHPTALVQRVVYAEHGLFDLQWKIGMDYDWLQRLHDVDLRGCHDSNICGHMSLGGVSDAGWILCLAEHREIALKYGGSPYIMYALYYLRTGKIRLRKLLSSILPNRIVVFLRSVVNSSLHSER